MNEFMIRLKAHPFVTLQLLGATLFINLLAFASPVFVMMILGQYVQTGFDQTLVTLSLGMLVAMLMQVSFTQARNLMADQLSTKRDEDISRIVFDVLTRAKTASLEKVPPMLRRKLLGQLQTVQTAYAPDAVAAVLDAPFLLLFIVAAFFLSPTLAWIGLFATLITVAAGLAAISTTTKTGESAQTESAHAKGVAAMAHDGAETVRAFGMQSLLTPLWEKHMTAARTGNTALAALRARIASDAQGIASLCRIGIYSVGAYECVLGELTFPALIGVNILIGRALRQATLFVNAGTRMSRAKKALSTLQDFSRLPLENAEGTALRAYTGRLEFKDVAFAHPGGTGPLFESVNLTLAPGTLTVVLGENGAGKTTLCRVIAGLIEPIRGEILADGITLRQLAPAWWRRQLTYFPQEPDFLQGTVAENIAMAAPETERRVIEDAVAKAGLEQWLSTQPNGLDSQLLAGTLSLGIRRRIALARALVTGGRLALFDDPSEGLDQHGAQVVSRTIAELKKNGATVIIFSHTHKAFPGADLLVNLNAKPVPEILRPAGKDGNNG